MAEIRFHLPISEGINVNNEQAFKDIRGLNKMGRLIAQQTTTVRQNSPSPEIFPNPLTEDNYLQSVFLSDGTLVTKARDSANTPYDVSGSKDVVIESISFKDETDNDWYMLAGATDTGIVASSPKHLTSWSQTVASPDTILAEYPVMGLFPTAYRVLGNDHNDTGTNTSFRQYPAKMTTYPTLFNDGAHQDVIFWTSDTEFIVVTFISKFDNRLLASTGYRDNRSGAVIARKFSTDDVIYTQLNEEILSIVTPLEFSFHISQFGMSFLAFDDDADVVSGGEPYNIGLYYLNIETLSFVKLATETGGGADAAGNTRAGKQWDRARAITGEAFVAYVSYDTALETQSRIQSFSKNETAGVLDNSGTVLASLDLVKALKPFVQGRFFASATNYFCIIEGNSGATTDEFHFFRETSTAIVFDIVRTINTGINSFAAFVGNSAIYGGNDIGVFGATPGRITKTAIGFAASPTIGAEITRDHGLIAAREYFKTPFEKGAPGTGDPYVMSNAGSVIEINETAQTVQVAGQPLHSGTLGDVDEYDFAGGPYKNLIPINMANDSANSISSLGYVGMSYFFEYDYGVFSNLAPITYFNTQSSSRYVLSFGFTDKTRTGNQLQRIRRIHILTSPIITGTISISEMNQVKIFKTIDVRAHDANAQYQWLYGGKMATTVFARTLLALSLTGLSYGDFTGQTPTNGSEFKSVHALEVGDFMYFGNVISETVFPNTLFFKRTNQAATIEAESNNFINFRKAEQITALGSLRGNIVAFSADTISIAQNNIPIETRFDGGCVHPNSVTEALDKLYYFFRDDFYYYNGIITRNLTEVVDKTIGTQSPSSIFFKKLNQMVVCFGGDELYLIDVFNDKVLTRIQFSGLRINRLYTFGDDIFIDDINTTSTARDLYKYTETFTGTGTTSIGFTTNEIFGNTRRIRITDFIMKSSSEAGTNFNYEFKHLNGGVITFTHNIQKSFVSTRLSKFNTFFKGQAEGFEIQMADNDQITEIRSIELPYFEMGE